jgi:hypothetical protein
MITYRELNEKKRSKRILLVSGKRNTSLKRIISAESRELFVRGEDNSSL